MASSALSCKVTIDKNGKSEKSESAQKGRTLNLLTLATMRDDYGDETLGEVVAIFVSSSGEQIEAVRVALACGDIKRLEREAHSLKSAAASLGADELSGIAAQLEHECAKGNLLDKEVCGELCRALCDEQVRAVAAIEAHMEPFKEAGAFKTLCA